MFNDLEGHFYLRDAHKYGNILGTFASFAAADAAAEKITRNHIAQAIKELRPLTKPRAKPKKPRAKPPTAWERILQDDPLSPSKKGS
jgi:hypothetical protein